MKYTVKSGDTIYDTAYNTAGSLGAVNAIMEANGIQDYSVGLQTGAELEFDAEILNNAASLKANGNPFNSSYISDTALNSLINDFTESMDTVRKLFTAIVLGNNTVITFGADNAVPVYKN